jgi:hypothetical protein
MEHTHPTGHGRLVFACPGCRAEVEADQLRAEVEEADKRHCTIGWRVDTGGGVEFHSGKAKLPIPAGWTDYDAVSFWAKHLDGWLAREVIRRYGTDPRLERLIESSYVHKIVVGRRVSEPKPGPAEDQLAMFE